MRNIYHELNTPITKGKILAELIEDSKNKKILESLFERLDNLVKELYKIERITSKNYKLQRKKIPIIELIDSAKELLYLDKIPHNITNERLFCDFDAMVIVFKNLIDNAIKYGKEAKILYENGSICFLSKGEKLEHNLSYYTQAFVSENESLGFGLYIVEEILAMHNMQLYYYHKNGVNYFCIR